MILHRPRPTLFPYTTLFRSHRTRGLPTTVGVLGGGRMGAGIAHAFLVNNAKVVVVERDNEAAQNARTRVESARSEEHTSELQSRLHLVCRPLLEKKKCR